MGISDLIVQRENNHIEIEDGVDFEGVGLVPK